MSVLCYFLFFSILLYSSLRASTANILGNETEKFALLAFKSEIILDPYNITASWNDSRHFCEWEGVTCSYRHQRVRELNLKLKNLLGSISPHIGNLSFLRILNLRNNHLSGVIPQELGHLFRLEHISLSNNSLVGKIPVNISLCSNLISLFLTGNNLTGKIPVDFGSLSKLGRLALDNNKLTGGIPPFLGNLTSLESISISGNHFRRSIPSTLGNLRNLKNLGLGSDMLSGEIPPSLYNLSTFEIISIENNQLIGNLPSDIGISLPNLQIFFIAMNRFSGPIPISLFNASNLQMIDMSLNQFTGKVPLSVGHLKGLQGLALHKNNLGSGKSGDFDFFTSLTNCSNLQEFSLGGNQFGGTLPISVANFSNQLSKLFLEENLISGTIPSEIENLNNLILLDLHANFFTGSIPFGIGNLQNLQALYLGSNQLSGEIPLSIRNMSHLYLIHLSYNMLEGSIASCLDNQMLQMLDMSHNRFSGTIPEQEIGISSSLINLNLAHNLLNGSIPLEMGSLRNLEYVDVSENKLLGEIILASGSFSSLEYLYLQGNFFHGSLPSLSSLKGLQVLDVSRNNMTGKIPKALENLSFLQNLNLSYNNFEDEVPIQGIFKNASAISVVGNFKICGGIPELKLPKCKSIQNSKKQGISHALKVILCVLLPSVLMLVVFLVIYLRKQPKAKPSSEQLPGELRRVSYNDLHKATEGFSSANLIGMGSYGSVYKGILHQDEGPIAVKVLNLMERGALKSFMAECETLRGVRHRNLLQIITVCSSVDFNRNDFKALVYKFMPNGSLESWFYTSSDGQHPPRSLNLFQRVNIAIDVASALDYLHNHCERPIIHCDLKSSNVLLDYDMIAHVGDFGLAKFIPKSNSTSDRNETNSIGLRGTIGYIPPEYGIGAEVSSEGDVYSYGILMLEMFTGKRPTDAMFKDGLSLHAFCKMALPQQEMDIIDVRLLSEDTESEAANDLDKMKECFSSLMRIGVACSEEPMNERKDIKDVLKELHSIREIYFNIRRE